MISAWVVLLAAAMPFVPQLPGVLRSGGFSLNHLEASRPRQVLETQADEHG